MVDDTTLAVMVDAKYQQAVLYKSYITIHFLEEKNSVLNFVTYAFSGLKKLIVAKKIYYKIKVLSSNKTNTKNKW